MELPKTLVSTDHNSLWKRWEAENIFAEVLPEDQIQNFTTIITPSLRSSYEVLDQFLALNTIAFHQSNTDDGAVKVLTLPR